MTEEEQVINKQDKIQDLATQCSKKINWVVIVFIGLLLISATLLFIHNQKPGRLQGLVSWQYNEFVGTKPDVGAKIFLFPTRPHSKIKDEDVVSFALGIIPEENKNEYYFAKANGNGNYTISNVKPGNYLVLIISENTNRNILDDTTVMSFSPLILDRILLKKHQMNLS